MSNIWGLLRSVAIGLDSVAFSLIDNIYNIIISLANSTIIDKNVVQSITRNMYAIIGIFALFRIAVSLINSLINPEKLSDSKKGVPKVVLNTFIAIILLVATPILFEESRNLQSTIIKGNYIQKLILGKKEFSDSNSKKTPGEEMQSIAIGSLISIDDYFLDKDGNPDESKCLSASTVVSSVIESGVSLTGPTSLTSVPTCAVAIATYKKMEKDDNYSFSVLTPINSVYVSDYSMPIKKLLGFESGKFKSKYYVINYKPLVLTVIGWFITYVMLSFAIDIAVRVFELFVLEILSPLFIVSYIDPNSASSGPFSKWLKSVGTTYLSLFLRLGALALIILGCSLIRTLKVPEAAKGAKLILLIGLLIFMKKAPKMVADMLGVDAEKSGLGGLGIGKKLGGMAILGGAATRLGHGLAAAAPGAARGLKNYLNDRKARKALGENVDNAGRRGLKGYASRAKERRNAFKDSMGNGLGSGVKGWFSQAKKQNKDGFLNNMLGSEGAKAAVAMGSGFGVAYGEGRKAENLKGAFTTGKLSVDKYQKGPASRLKLSGKTTMEALKEGVASSNDKIISETYGTPSDMYDKQKKMEARELRTKYFNPKYSDNEDAIVKQGAFNALMDKLNIENSPENARAVVGLTAIADKDSIRYNSDNGTLSCNVNGISRTFANVADANNYIESSRVLTVPGIAAVEKMSETKLMSDLSTYQQMQGNLESIYGAINNAMQAQVSTLDRLSKVQIPSSNGGTFELGAKTLDQLKYEMSRNPESDVSKYFRDDPQGKVDYNLLINNEKTINTYSTLLGDTRSEFERLQPIVETALDTVQEGGKNSTLTAQNIEGIKDALNRKIEDAENVIKMNNQDDKNQS